MNAGTRLLAFVAGCAVLFGVALGVGHLVGPVAADPGREAGHDMVDEEDGHGEMTEMAAGAHGVAGLEASAGGYTLTLAEPRLDPGRQRLTFTVTDAHGDPLTAYDAKHERDLHLVVVRRGLTGYQHLHPVLDAVSGEWSADAALTPGAWRVLADFTPSGGEPHVLGADLLVPGQFAPEPLGADTRVAQADDYEVTLDRTAASYRQTILTATVTRDGVPVTDLQPYLAAYGHLVALRDGDVGYLHVHPEEGAGPGPEVGFRTEFPGGGRYRLFFDFRHGDAVHTAVFTLTVAGDDEH